MTSVSRIRNVLGKYKVYLIIGVPLVFIALAPFPLGCGMIYPIGDSLRGHPQGPHGNHPQKFVGLWIRDETVMFDFLGQAFYLMPNGRFAGMSGMTERRWHFDDNSLYIDSVSRCGNCYQGNVTSEYSVRFIGTDQLLVENNSKDVKRGIGGKYRKFEITDNLKAELSRQEHSTDENGSFKARTIQRAIEQFERLSRLKR